MPSHPILYAPLLCTIPEETRKFLDKSVQNKNRLPLAVSFFFLPISSLLFFLFIKFHLLLKNTLHISIVAFIQSNSFKFIFMATLFPPSKLLRLLSIASQTTLDFQLKLYSITQEGELSVHGTKHLTQHNYLHNNFSPNSFISKP